MKTIFLVTLMACMSFVSFSESSPLKSSQLHYTSDHSFKAIDFTVNINGFIIHIVGTSSFNSLTGYLSINVTVTITGNGINLSVPLAYNGPMDAGRGSNVNKYDSRTIADEDKTAVDVIMSRIYLPQDKDPKKVMVYEFEKQ